MNNTHQFDRRRHSERVAMRVPVEVRATAVDGTVVEESTHTSVVGILGAMLQISRPLQMSADIVVTNRFSQQTAKFRVAWLGDQRNDGLWDVGIEAFQPLDDFWGVRFSPRPGPS